MQTSHQQEIRAILIDLQKRCPVGAICKNLFACFDRGQWDQMLRCCELRLKGLQSSSDLYAKGAMHMQLGTLHEIENNPDQALLHYREAAQIFRICDRRIAGLALASLGIVYGSLAQMEKASQSYQEGVEILSSLRDPLTEKVSIWQSKLGQLLEEHADRARSYQKQGEDCEAQGQWSEARKYYNSALELFQHLGDNRAISEIQAKLQKVIRQEQSSVAAENPPAVDKQQPTRGEQPPSVPWTTLRLVPVVGRVPAGSLREAIEANLGDVQVGEVLIDGKRYSVESLGDKAVSEVRLRPGSTYFALQAKGESMEDANVADGDYVLFESQEDAADRDIVVMLIDGQTTLKRFFQKLDHVFLQPENPEESPIVITESDELVKNLQEQYGDHKPPVEIKLASNVRVMGKALSVFKPV
jgi:SOS-response transcriptional repressor LexA